MFVKRAFFSTGKKIQSGLEKISIKQGGSGAGAF